MRNKIFQGDALEVLKTLPDECVHMCVTSPPYWGLRTYHVDGQIGLEDTPIEFVNKLVSVFREVKRVLRGDGTFWLNIGDCYSPQSSHKGGTMYDGFNEEENWEERSLARDNIPSFGKPKDLMGIPWRLAFALQSDGWYIRSDIIWAKPNCMPSPVKDRPTNSHEHIFLLTKKPRYFYDCDAIREPHQKSSHERYEYGLKAKQCDDDSIIKANVKGGILKSEQMKDFINPRGANKRDVWWISPQPYPDSHFAVFPEKLAEPCILAGTSEAGCCGVCGSPYVRLVEEGEPIEEWKSQCGADSTGEYHGESEKWLKQDKLGKQTYTGFNKRWKEKQQNASDVKRRILNGMVEKTTVCWEPTCACNSEKRSAPIVLDPFMGAGTTALVALKNARDFIGIELNPEYIALAEKRISKYRVKRLSEF